jgi:carboxyl-terminal processing protease
VNRHGFCIHLNRLTATFLCLVLWALAPAAAQGPATSQPTTSDFQRHLEANSLWRMGVELAIEGDFSAALEMVRKAERADPGDQYIAEGAAALDGYVSRREQFEADRREEYARAVQRVRRGMLAQTYRPKLVAAGLAEPPGEGDEAAEPEAGTLRAEVEQGVIDPYNSVNSAATLEELTAEEARELKQRALDATQEMAVGLDEAVALLDGDGSEYAEQFSEVADEVAYYVRVYRNGWQGVRLDGEESREAAADTLSEVEEKLSDALSGLEMMSAEKPWRAALAQGIRARMLHREGNGELAVQGWYNELIAMAERRAADAVQKADWYDAAAAYAGLEDLSGDNGTYEQQVTQARRHVRVLGLYGEENGEASETQPAPDPSWRDLVAGADAEMVRQAIRRLDQYYVTAVDYRELANGALMAMKVLAETPQASASFPSLEDDAKREKFLKSVESMRKNLAQKHRVDSLDLQFLLNSVLRASQRSVDFPAEVIAVEFADGMLNELDKFSAMIWPHDVTDFEKHTKGHFYGVGIQITKEMGEPLEVVTPLAGTPAYRAGIKPGDIITSVDGRRTDDLSIDKLVRMIMGEQGTRVTLRIKRPGRVKPFDVPIIRDKITIRTVKGWRRLHDGGWDYSLDADRGVGYVRCTQFSEQTPEELVEALDQLKDRELNALVLDLRWNPGGLLGAAVEVADEFLDQGRRIVSTKGRQVRYDQRSAEAKGRYQSGALVVLVNDASASASEIVSGALQDWNRAVVVGERTYGKGSVQNVIRIRHDRAMLKLTTAYYYLPHGRLLHRTNGDDEWGVEPNIDVPMTPKQVRRWLEIRRETDLIQDVDPRELDRELAKQYASDLQLQAAVVLLKLIQLDEARSAA